MEEKIYLDAIYEFDKGSSDSYFDEELDFNDEYFRKLKNDVEFIRENDDKEIYDAFMNYEEKASITSYYWIGYYICFTYLGIKYHFSSNFKNKLEELKLLYKLKELGCTNICIREGHLD